MAERWLISYQCQPCWGPQTPGSTFQEGEPFDLVELIEKHPVRFVLDMMAAYREFCQRAKPGGRGDKLTRVYWTMPAPESLITEADIEALS